MNEFLHYYLFKLEDFLDIPYCTLRPINILDVFLEVRKIHSCRKLGDL